jgi:hypothetical protein
MVLISESLNLGERCIADMGMGLRYDTIDT